MAQFTLSRTSEWTLANDNQDIRGWPVRDTTDTTLGEVEALIADDQTREVEMIVLEDGRQFPTRDIDLGDGVVYVKSATRIDPLHTTSNFDAEHYRDHYTTTYATTGEPFDTYEPAYRFGHERGMNTEYRDRDWNDLEPTFRSDYENTHGRGMWDRFKDAVRHSFDNARRHDEPNRTHRTRI